MRAPSPLEVVAQAEIKYEPTGARVAEARLAPEGAPMTIREPSLIAETGLKARRTVEDRVSYNPEKINAPEDVATIFKDISREAAEFKGQRLSKDSAEVRRLADLVDITPEELAASRPGSIANAETTFRARELTMTLAQDLKNFAKTIDMETATPEQLTQFRNKYMRLMGTMKAVAGFRTESSNLMRQFKQKVSPIEDPMMREMLSEVKRVDMRAGENLEMFTKGAKKLMEPTLADKAWHLWYASILSGPSTQIKNFLGNTTQMGAEVVRTAATNPTEFPSAMMGLYRGLLKGRTEFKRIMKEGEVSKFQERGLKPVVFKGKARFLNAADYVGRFMAATDAFYKEGFRGMEARALAREQAKAEGLRGEGLKSRINELYEEKLGAPEADAFALRGTYMQDPQGALGTFAKMFQRGAREFPPLRLFVPFTRVVANVVNNSLDWSPLGVYRAISPEIHAKLARGKSVPEVPKMTSRQRYHQIGRGVLGTVGMMYAASLAAEGKLTGNGPQNYKHKQQLMAMGWRPNSIEIGGRYWPYMNWGPMAVPLALIGNYNDAVKYGDVDPEDLMARVSAATLGSMNSILDMSFLSGISNLQTAIQEYQRRGAKYLERFIAQNLASAIPNAAKQVARYFDSNIYETNSIKEMIQSQLRIPHSLKRRLNIWGEPLIGEKLTQLQPVKKTKDPLKLYLAEQGIWISHPVKGQSNILDRKTGKRRSMDEDEYYNYIKYSGQRIHRELSANLRTIKALPSQDQKRKFVSDTVNRIRKSVRQEIQLGILK